MVHDDLAHGPGGQRQEVAAIADVQARTIGQLDVRFVDEAGGHQRFLAALAAELRTRQGAQLLIQQREQLARRLPVTPAPSDNQPRHLCRGVPGLLVARHGWLVRWDPKPGPLRTERTYFYPGGAPGEDH